MNEKITAVEQGLRYRVQIKNRPTEKMALSDRMAYYKIPGVSIALINNGAIEWSKGYGTISADSSEPITTDTLFQAASISKLVTAVGVLKLVQEGQLVLDEDVNRYLKTWTVPENEFTKTEKVTLRRLLSHSAGTSISGFPGYAVGHNLPTMPQILDGIKPANTEAVRVVMTPGTKFQYSGGGICIVQQLIEDVTNMPFQKWMKEQVFNPLKMGLSTYEQPLPQALTLHAAHGHLSTGKAVSGYWHIYPELAAAGLWTTPSDLARLAIALQSILRGEDNGILTTSLVKEMLSSQILIHGDLYAGLGVFLRQETDNLIYRHSGLNRGFGAQLEMHSDENQGVVIMTNGDVNDFYLEEELMNSIADAYDWTNAEPIQKTEILLDSTYYERFVGRFYLSDDLEDFSEIYIRDGKLFFRPAPEIPPMQLFLEAENQFFTREENQTIYFKQRNDNNCDLIVKFEDDQIWGQSVTYYKKPMSEAAMGSRIKDGDWT